MRDCPYCEATLAAEAREQKERAELLDALERALFVMDTPTIARITNGGGCMDYIRQLLTKHGRKPEPSFSDVFMDIARSGAGK